MIPALIGASALVGFLLAWFILPRKDAPGYVAAIRDSKVPRHRVEYLAEQAIVAMQNAEARVDMHPKIEEAIRGARIRFLPHRFLPQQPDTPHENGERLAVYGAEHVWLTNGDGWETRLGLGLAQLVNMRLTGNVDREWRGSTFDAGRKTAKEIADGIRRRPQGAGTGNAREAAGEIVDGKASRPARGSL